MESGFAHDQTETDEPRRIGDILRETTDITGAVDESRAADVAARDAASELAGLHEQVAEVADADRAGVDLDPGAVDELKEAYLEALSETQVEGYNPSPPRASE